MNIERNEYLIIMDMIYNIYNIQVFEEMKQTLLKQLKILIPFAGASVLMIDDKLHLKEPVCYPEEFEAMERKYMEIEELDYCRWITINGESQVIRDSDLLPEEKRIASLVYQECFQPAQIHYCLDLSLAYDKKQLGIITLYRRKMDGDFTDKDMFYLDSLKKHLNIRFYQEVCGNRSVLIAPQQITRLAVSYRLTNKEIEVLTLLFEDRNYNEAAQQLCISSHTLKKHVQNIYKKLGISSKWELLKFRTNT